MKKLSLALACGALALAGTVQAQDLILQEIFKVDAGPTSTTATLPWFTWDTGGPITEGVSTVRGLAYNPSTGNLLVAARNEPHTSDTIHVLSAITGLEIDTLDPSIFYDGVGFFNIQKVATDESGRIFVSNLAINDRPTTDLEAFRLYMFDDENDVTPTIAYQQDEVPVRWGDALAVTGSGANTKILVGGRNHQYVALLTDGDNDGNFTSTTLSLVSGGQHNVAFDGIDPDNEFWLSFTSSNLDHYKYNVSGASLTSTTLALPGDAVGTQYGPFALAQRDTSQLIAVSPGNIPATSTVDVTGVKGYLYDVDNPTVAIGETGGLEAGTNWTGNENGVGQVVFDDDGDRVFFLVTDNSISGWNIYTATEAGKNWKDYE